jgi:MFS family permease
MGAEDQEVTVMAVESSATEVDPRRWWALGVLSLVLIVIGMDNLILNVALPTLVRQLHATPAQLQWIVDGYILAYAALLLSMGSLGAWGTGWDASGPSTPGCWPCWQGRWPQRSPARRPCSSLPARRWAWAWR